MGILQKLRAGTANRKTIKFPGTDIDVDLVPLTDALEQEAEFAAERIFKTAKIDIAFHNVDQLQQETRTQKLYRALRVTGTDDPLEATITDFRQNITRIEQDLIVDELNAFSEAVNPSPYNMSVDEFDALTESLKKKPKETISSVSSFFTLKKLSLCLVNLLSSLPTDNGSTS